MTENDRYLIVLEPVAEDSQAAAALFLSGCFSLPPSSTRRIAASGPIAILSDMSEHQATTVLKELANTVPEGAELRIGREGAGAGVSRLEWPRAPKIYGRPLDEFDRAPEHSFTACPACGKMLKMTYDPGGGLRVGLAGVSGKTVMIPNPGSSGGDRDPLFSGFKPMAADTQNLASMRSLQAGDSSFWLDPKAFFPPAPAGPPDGGGVQSKGNAGLAAFMNPGVFTVVLARSRDSQVVKMVSEILGVGEDEARDLCRNLSLRVAKDIALDEAQNLLARFKSLGAKARIVKPM